MQKNRKSRTDETGVMGVLHGNEMKGVSYMKTLATVRDRLEQEIKEAYPSTACETVVDLDDLYAMNDALRFLEDALKAQKPKYLEVPFYRNLVLEHMACAGVGTPELRERLKDPEAVWKETVRISKARTQKEIQARYAYYYGQLALLDYIQKMQNTYTAPANGD